MKLIYDNNFSFFFIDQILKNMDSFSKRFLCCGVFALAQSKGSELSLEIRITLKDCI